MHIISFLYLTTIFQRIRYMYSVSHATLYIRPAFLKTKNSAKICQCLFVLSLPIFVIIMVQITRSTKLHFI